MTRILLSIKPEYVDKIISGEKKYEYRKHLSHADIDSILIYSTTPVQRIIGEVSVIGKLSMTPTLLWNTTRTASGITYEKYKDYFADCETASAYELGVVHVFERPRKLVEYGITHAPQSFCYISENV